MRSGPRRSGLCRRLRAVLCGVAVVGATAGCSTAVPSGPLFPAGEQDTVCGPVALYRDAAITQPIEPSGDDRVRITGVAVGDPVNLRVSRVRVGPLHSLPLLGTAVSGADAPRWSAYGPSFAASRSRPAQAVAQIHVLDPHRDASAGPFVVSYSIDGHPYRSRAVVSYRVAAHDCD